nr:hypothetical protein CIT39_24970 [Bradyrhizobium symbiodeficiens]
MSRHRSLLRAAVAGLCRDGLMAETAPLKKRQGPAESARARRLVICVSLAIIGECVAPGGHHAQQEGID